MNEYKSLLFCIIQMNLYVYTVIDCMPENAFSLFQSKYVQFTIEFKHKFSSREHRPAVPSNSDCFSAQALGLG